MGQLEERSVATTERDNSAVIHEDVDVRELALEPTSFKGRNVSVAGWVSRVEARRAGYLVHLNVPVPDGVPGEMRAVVAECGETPPVSPGLFVVVRGVCDDIHVIAVPNRCGIIVVPLVKAHLIESRVGAGGE